MNGFRLCDITWEEAARMAEEQRTVVLPVGAGTKEHGPHLPCGTDMFLADELGRRLLEEAPILLLPTLPYAYYPAFIDWPGSVSIEAQNFIAFVKDIIRSLQRHGFKKFLILDTGVSTHAALRILSSDLHNELGVRVAVTNAVALLEDVERQVAEQERGGHADEMETSMMLKICPELVQMQRVVKEYRRGAPLLSVSGQPKVVMGGKMDTSSGIHGDATLATAEKGTLALDAMTRDILLFLESFQQMAD
jgi:creatinine amidohydrolase